jgi:hypothetical protein
VAINMDEIFKDIEGFNNYEVSNKGTVRRKPREYKSPQYNGIKSDYYYFKQRKDKDGYLDVGIRDNNGKRKYIRVHRLVAITFLPNHNNFPVVNHKNGIKDDNRASNLEWCTISYNTKHAFEKLGRKGHNGGMNKKVLKLDRHTLEVVGEYESLKEASLSIGVNQINITKCIEREKRDVDATCGGFKWKLVDEDVTTIESTLKDGSE